MKKLFLLIILIMAIALCAAAQAETDVPFIPAGRVQLRSVSDRLDYTAAYSTQSGTWEITINASAMTKDDWVAVIADGYNGSSVKLFDFGVSEQQYPANYSFAGALTMSNDTEEDAYQFYLENLDALKNYSSMGFPSGSIMLGYYDPDTGVFLPADITQKMYCAFGFRWKSTNGGDDLVEHSLYTVTFKPSLPATIEASISAVPAGNISLDPRVNGSKANGRFAYSLEKPEAEMTLATLLTPPAAGAVAYQSGRGLPMDDVGNAILETKLYPREYAYEDCHVITWKNGSSTTYQRVTEQISVGKAKRWPEYVDDLKPFTQNSFSYAAYGSTKGVKLNVDEFKDHAELRLTHDINELIRDAAKGVDLTQAGMKLSITPPDNAVYYRNFPSGNTSTIYGMDLADRSYPLKNGNEEIVQPELVKGSDLKNRLYSYLSKKEIPLANGGTTTYYYCEGIKGDLAGLVDMYFWYDQDMNLIGQNYVIHTMDDLPLIATQPLLSKDGDKDKFRGTPFAVALNSAMDVEEIILQAVRYPSSGGSHCYDLKLTTTEGDAVNLNGEEIELYLPFPEGHSENSVRKLNLTVGHYTKNHELIASDVYTLENGKLEITPYGLKLKVKSFSPYVVSWDEEVVAVPRTGDAFPMSLVLGAMFLSLAVLLVMKKKTA